MKKFIIYLVSMVAISSISISCSQDFLDEEMISTVTQQIYETPDGLDQLVIGCYDGLRYMYDMNPGWTYYHATADDGSHETYLSTKWADNGGAGSSTNSLMCNLQRQWHGCYAHINACNRAIEIMESGKVGGQYANADYANTQKAQVLFIRSWMYHILNTILGDVYIQSHSTTEIPKVNYFPRATSEDLWKMMIGDLRVAYGYAKDGSSYTGSEGRERVTKGAIAHLLAKLYLERSQAKDWKQYRKADGSIDRSNANAHLGMLYKGNVSTDLDSCIYYATQVIDNPYYELEDDYNDIFKDTGDSSTDNSKEVILAASFSYAFGAGDMNNGRYDCRYYKVFGRYTNSLWGLPGRTYEYGYSGGSFATSDWGYDVFNNKFADSRYQKTFYLELQAHLADDKDIGQDKPYYAYNDSKNGTVMWSEDAASYFNANILPSYNNPSWTANGRTTAVAGQHKIGATDIGVAYIENTKETAIDMDYAMALPYVVCPRWTKDATDDKYYYRSSSVDNFQTLYSGFEKGQTSGVPFIKKFMNKNRIKLNSDYGYRNVATFRIAETYLIRAEAYGRQNHYDLAINDINKIRERAAYKTGEKRAQVLAMAYPGSTSLPATEQAYPYTVSTDMTASMRIDETYWDGASAESVAENYPPMPSTGFNDEKLWRFVNFINNELSRECAGELVTMPSQHHAGIQYERMVYHNQYASPEGMYTWPVADNTLSTQGQTGKGKGFYQKYNTFWPYHYTFLQMLQKEDGTAYTDAEQTEYQNPGY